MIWYFEVIVWVCKQKQIWQYRLDSTGVTQATCDPWEFFPKQVLENQILFFFSKSLECLPQIMWMEFSSGNFFGFVYWKTLVMPTDTHLCKEDIHLQEIHTGKWDTSYKSGVCPSISDTLAWSLTLDIGLNNYFMKILRTDVKEKMKATCRYQQKPWDPLLFPPLKTFMTGSV